jgi:hypothetical protein
MKAPWSVASQTRLNNGFVRSVAYDADGGELCAGTAPSGLWPSTDNRLTWTLESTGLDSWATYRLVLRITSVREATAPGQVRPRGREGGKPRDGPRVIVR